MRVALLSYNAQAGDAIGNNVAEKLHFFRDRAADVRVFVESDQRLHPAVTSHCHLMRPAEPRGEHWRFIRSADLISAEFGQYYSLVSLLPLLAGEKPRMLLDYHGITPPELWGGHNREALVRGLQHRGLAWLADATITHSSFIQDELAAFTGLPRQRLPRLGFPVDLSLLTPAAKGCDRPRVLGLEGKRIVLFVGRLAPNKRPDLLVEALSHLRDLTPAVHGVMVGDSEDVYQNTAQLCRARANELGMTDRLHLAGRQLGPQLRDFYRAADVLVVPSQWESFCIPVIEAMACGVPVIAARSTALPETVASAGLTFKVDDAEDLARQIRRVLDAPAAAVAMAPRWKIGVIACRFGVDFASGAEASLRQIALALQQAHCDVEVFTTCTRSEMGQTNELPRGTSMDSGLVVHRFAVDLPAIQPGGQFAHPIHSRGLLDALSNRVTEFDYLVTGPYLAGLTVDVAERWPDKNIVVPCFHDEPAVRQAILPTLYDRVAGMFYHTEEEQNFAERELGVNHPGAAVIGTHLNMSPGDAARGREIAGTDRYVVYCGRYSEGKNLALLLDHARRFAGEHPGTLRFVFTGQGNVAIPREPWAVDLGFIAPDTLRDVLAGAVALVQLSCNESLSLAALEAWAQAIPVMAHRDCAVLADHITCSGGGILIGDFDEFATAISTLDGNAQLRQQLGLAGQGYVSEYYGSAETFQKRLVGALEHLRQPLATRMRQRGLERAAKFDRTQWRQQFGTLVENVLHSEPRQAREDLVVQPRGKRCGACPGAAAILVPVRVVNRGNVAAVADGPGRTVLGGTVVDLTNRIVCHLDPPTALPALLMPGRALSASVRVPVPQTPGDYEIHLWARRCDRVDTNGGNMAALPFTIGEASELARDDGQGAGLMLDEVQSALVEANGLQRLPDDYADVTQGVLAGIKRRVKTKLLGNFKKAYVDVLSRQQSACNQQLLAASHALAECCATLDHAVRVLQERVAQLEVAAKINEGSSPIGNRFSEEAPLSEQTVGAESCPAETAAPGRSG